MLRNFFNKYYQRYRATSKEPCRMCGDTGYVTKLHPYYPNLDAQVKCPRCRAERDMEQYELDLNGSNDDPKRRY